MSTMRSIKVRLTTLAVATLLAGGALASVGAGTASARSYPGWTIALEQSPGLPYAVTLLCKTRVSSPKFGPLWRITMGAGSNRGALAKVGVTVRRTIKGKTTIVSQSGAEAYNGQWRYATAYASIAWGDSVQVGARVDTPDNRGVAGQFTLKSISQLVDCR